MPSIAPSDDPARFRAPMRALISWARTLNLLGFATLLAALILWELAIATGWVNLRFMAAPSEILSALLTLLASGELLRVTSHTLRSVVGGWLLAVGLGISIGTLLGVSRRASEFALASIDFMRSMPSIALVAPAVLIFGFSVEMEVVVILFGSIWPVIINTMGGIQRVPREMHDVARIFRLGPIRKAWSILLPAAAPSVLVGARLAMAVALILAVVSEMVGNPQGLGYAIIFEQLAIRPDRMFGYVVTIGLLGVILNAVLVKASLALPAVGARAEDRSG